jgi:hypothetical protein
MTKHNRHTHRDGIKIEFPAPCTESLFAVFMQLAIGHICWLAERTKQYILITIHIREQRDPYAALAEEFVKTARIAAYSHSGGLVMIR